MHDITDVPLAQRYLPVLETLHQYETKKTDCRIFSEDMDIFTLVLTQGILQRTDAPVVCEREEA